MLDFRPVYLRFSIVMVFALFFANAQSQVYNYADGEGPTPPDSIRGLYVGLNLGVYFANKNTAFIYDGRGYERDGAFISNFSNTWLSQAIQGNNSGGGSNFQQRRTNVAMESKAGRSFTTDDWEFIEDNTPQVMTFSGSFMYGAHLRYMFNSDFGVFAEVSGTNPVTVGEFTIRDKNPSSQPGEFGLYKFGIRGEEQRLMVNLGMHRVMLRKYMEQKGNYNPTILPYFDAGMNMTMVRFEANFIDMGPVVGSVNLMNEINNQNQFITEANILTGVGFGGFAGIGGQITIGRKFTIDIGYVASFETIKLGEVKELGLQNQLVLKAIYM